jgi:hypothetical protein
MCTKKCIKKVCRRLFLYRILIWNINTIGNFLFLEPSTPIKHDSYGIQSNPNPPEIKEEQVEMEQDVEEEDDDEEEVEEETPSELSFFISILSYSFLFRDKNR